MDSRTLSRPLGRISVLLLLLAPFLVPSAASAGGGERRPVDALNGIAFEIPEGWHFLLPDPAGVVGSTTLFNYDPHRVVLDGEPQESHFPPGRIKIDVTGLRLAKGQAFSDLSEVRRSEVRGLSTLANPIRLGEAAPVRLAGLAGEGYTVDIPGQVPVLQIHLARAPQRVLSISIRPADSPLVPEAIRILDAMELLGGENLRGVASPAVRELPADPAVAVESALDDLQAVFDASSHPCNAGGTYSGGEASSSPITLHMPFSAGTRWRVGAGGSYFGNGYHCNIYNDYYATDWNVLYSTGDCNNYQPSSEGQNVQPMADGTVVYWEESTTGYGNQVIVEHSGGIRTRYAHLQTILVKSGNVSRTTVIGKVGSTGNSTGPHLHLGFMQYTGGGWYSHCYNNGAGCPNGEGASWPQTAKPSPIQTSTGSVALADFGCYVSANSGGWSAMVDDGAAYFYGPQQYWYTATGLGQNNSMRYTYNIQNGESNFVYWPFNVPSSGYYKIEVFVPRDHATTTRAQYYLWNGSSWSFLTAVNQNGYYDSWVALTSSVWLSSGVTHYVKLTDNTGEASSTTKVGVDAIRISAN